MRVAPTIVRPASAGFGIVCGLDPVNQKGLVAGKHLLFVGCDPAGRLRALLRARERLHWVLARLARGRGRRVALGLAWPGPPF